MAFIFRFEHFYPLKSKKRCNLAFNGLCFVKNVKYSNPDHLGSLICKLGPIYFVKLQSKGKKSMWRSQWRSAFSEETGKFRRVIEMESEHFPIKVSEDIIRVYQNGPEHRDLEHGQNHYIKGHFFQLSTNFFHVHSWYRGKIFFFLTTLTKMVPSKPKSV